MTGFTYNGVHCSEFGLYYIPSREDQWFSDPEYDVYDTDIDWRHGGVYFASKAKVRTFTIKCFFEEIDIKTKQRIKEWVGRDTSGTLFFDDMPFIYWIVHPGKIPVGDWYLDNNETHSGTVTITFNAYEPFGYLIRRANSEASPADGSDNYVDYLAGADMPAEPHAGDSEFDVYNPGTEECGLTIDLGGTTSNPFRFYNETNKTRCEFNSLPPTGMRLMINGENGFVSVYMIGASGNDVGFAYHDRGVLRLEPNNGGSGIQYHYTGKNGSLYSFELEGYHVSTKLIGAKMTIDGIDGAVFEVKTVFRGTNKIYCAIDNPPAFPEEGTCCVRTLNHIIIEEKVDGVWKGPTTLNLSYLAIDYKPKAM